MSKTFFNVVVVFLAVISVSNGVPASAQVPSDDVRNQTASEGTGGYAVDERLPELLTQMGEEMQQINTAPSGVERTRLLTAHRQTIQEAMRLMRDMGGADVTDFWAHMEMPSQADQETTRSAGGGAPARRRPASVRGSLSLEQRIAALETRTDMLQILMEVMADTSEK